MIQALLPCVFYYEISFAVGHHFGVVFLRLLFMFLFGVNEID